jgi:hypothetical protein
MPRRSTLAVPLVAAAAAWLLYLVPGVVGWFGVFIDELYYVSCANRLAWGYVDHPPLAPFLLRGSLAIFGDSLLALRVPAATFGALVVFGTGWIARRLGATTFGQAVACGAVISSPLLQVLFGFYSMNAIELLLWLVLGGLLVEIERTGRSPLWLAFGVVAGLALLTKHTVTTYAMALGAAMLVTPSRRHLRDPYLWAGAAIAAIMALPNVLWQQSHGWPSLEFYRNAALYKNNPASPVEVVMQQVLFMSPGVLPLTLAGLVWFWRHADRRLRHLTVQFVVMLGALMWSAQSRPDRLAGLYPLLFAAGGVSLGELAASRRWVRVALPCWVIAWGALLLPVGTPVLSPDATAAHLARLGIAIQSESGEGKKTALPQYFADRLGWQALVDQVAAIRDSLPEGDRARVAFFAPSYGQASALDWLGRPRGLSPVYSTHNTWFYWGPPKADPQVAIVLGDDREHLEALFSEVRLAAEHQCGRCMPWRNGMPIWVVRGPKAHLADKWPGWKHFE